MWNIISDNKWISYWIVLKLYWYDKLLVTTNIRIGIYISLLKVVTKRQRRIRTMFLNFAILHVVNHQRKENRISICRQSSTVCNLAACSQSAVYNPHHAVVADSHAHSVSMRLRAIACESFVRRPVDCFHFVHHFLTKTLTSTLLQPLAHCHKRTLSHTPTQLMQYMRTILTASWACE